MSHKEQVEYIARIRAKMPYFFEGVYVLDCGSLDINGNNQDFFSNSHYTGIDLGPGRNVDFISAIHEFRMPKESYDVIISTEVFEHDMFYIASLKNIFRLLKPGGLLIFTCATLGRAEHGTQRTSPSDAPLLPATNDWSNYYKNLTEEDICAEINLEKIFKSYEFSINNAHKDLQFYGLKRGTHSKSTERSFHILNSITQRDKQTWLEITDRLSALLESQTQETDRLSALLESQTQETDRLSALLESQTQETDQLMRKYQTLKTHLISLKLSRSWKLLKIMRVLRSYVY